MGSQAEEREENEKDYIVFKSWSAYVRHMFLVCTWVIVAGVLVALAWLHFIA